MALSKFMAFLFCQLHKFGGGDSHRSVDYMIIFNPTPELRQEIIVIHVPYNKPKALVARIKGFQRQEEKKRIIMTLCILNNSASKRCELAMEDDSDLPKLVLLHFLLEHGTLVILDMLF